MGSGFMRMSAEDRERQRVFDAEMLCEAAGKGDRDLARNVLDSTLIRFPDLINSHNKLGSSPIWIAALNGHEGIVRYLWEVAYPGGATPAEALTFFADDIRYEDFNYYEPFVGLDKVPFVELHNPFTLPSPTKEIVVVHNL